MGPLVSNYAAPPAIQRRSSWSAQTTVHMAIGGRRTLSGPHRCSWKRVSRCCSMQRATRYPSLLQINAGARQVVDSNSPSIVPALTLGGLSDRPDLSKTLLVCRTKDLSICKWLSQCPRLFLGWMPRQRSNTLRSWRKCTACSRQCGCTTPRLVRSPTGAQPAPCRRPCTAQYRKRAAF